MRASFVLLLLALGIVAVSACGDAEEHRVEFSQDSPGRMAEGCAAHCVDYGGEFTLHGRRTLQGVLYGWCQCIGDDGVVSSSVRGMDPGGAIQGETPFKRTEGADRLDWDPQLQSFRAAAPPAR